MKVAVEVRNTSVDSVMHSGRGKLEVKSIDEMLEHLPALTCEK